MAHKTERRGWYDAIADLIPSLPESSFAQWQLDRLPEMYKTAVQSFIVHPTDQRTCPVVDSDRPLFTLTQNQGGNKLKAFVVNGTANDRGSTVTVVDADKPIFTIGASQDKRPVRSWLENGRVVALNSRCLARLQTLPNWYELPEKASLAGQGIGNGVPCLFAEKILELS